MNKENRGFLKCVNKSLFAIRNLGLLSVDSEFVLQNATQQSKKAMLPNLEGYRAVLGLYLGALFLEIPTHQSLHPPIAIASQTEIPIETPSQAPKKGVPGLGLRV